MQHFELYNRSYKMQWPELMEFKSTNFVYNLNGIFQFITSLYNFTEKSLSDFSTVQKAE